MGVARRREDADGLVERVDHAPLRPFERPPVERDDTLLVDFARWVRDELAVHRHAPVRDHALGHAARCHAGVREVLGEAHLLQPLHRWTSSCSSRR